MRLDLAIVRPLRHRDFRLLWTGQTISFFGNALYGIALPFQILYLGGSPLQLGTGFAIFSGTQLAMSLFGGVLVDRLSRRRVILISDLVSGIAVGTIATLGLTHHLRIEYLYVGSAFFGAAAAFYLPAMSAIMPELVPKETLVAGNSLRGISRQVNRIIGPAAGGLIVSAAGPPTAFAIDSATFFLSFFIFLLSTPTSAVGTTRGKFLNELGEGLRFTASVSWIWMSIIAFGVVNLFFFAAFTTGLPLLVRNVLHGGPQMFGLIGAFGGIGEIVGSVGIAQIKVRRPGIVMYVGSAICSLAVLSFGALPLLPVVLVASAVFAAGLVVLNTLWDSSLQKNVPGHLLGRVTSVDWFGSILLGPPAPLLAAVLAEHFGAQSIFLVGGLIAVVVSVVPLLIPAIRRLQ